MFPLWVRYTFWHGVILGFGNELLLYRARFDELVGFLCTIL